MNPPGVADPATRVALLARPGAACERLQVALQDAGADIVLVVDPAQSDAAGVRATGAQAILIALEPLVDEALDRYDALLADPDFTVIFDEAELAAQREGWDAARWVRHLAAKLNRHEQVLPPGAEADSAPAELARPRTPEQAPAGDVDMGDFLADLAIGSLDIPADTIAPGPAPDAAAHPFDPTVAEFDLTLDVVGPSAVSEQTHPFDPTLAEFDLGPGPAAPAVRDEVSAFDPSPADLDLARGPASPAAPQAAHPFDPALADFDLTLETGDAPPATPADFNMPTLEALEPASSRADVADDKGSNERFRVDLEALELRIADMQLEDVRPARAASLDGAVLVMAGIGGPDAVRQLLSGLPAGFPRPVLIQQRLEGARHDNLVRQMQRATSMPVRLAAAGTALERGHVYVLPTGVGVAQQADGLHFNAGGEDLVSGLPAADSAVVLLSGADVEQVDAVLALGLRGALVAGQSPDGCFDPIASEALVARGGTAAAPADIAKQLATRWPT